jgi:superoxide reductase
MAKLGELTQTADWKNEKHVPVIECDDQVEEGKLFDVKAVIGKEIAHPNTSNHHIKWIQLFFKPEGDKFTYQVGHYEFIAHGESTEGPDKGPVHSQHTVLTSMKINQPGELIALSFCNIHGLWENSKSVTLK